MSESVRGRDRTHRASIALGADSTCAEPSGTVGRSEGPRVGVVVIGRNEGERLPPAVRAARAGGAPVVYADSGSTDGSVELARAEGADIVGITEPPFTAARGRNEGLRRLCRANGGLEYVQFVDGDTTIDPTWIDAAVRTLDADSSVAGVCGRLSERGAARSIWRRLMATEWAGPAGEIATCGGNAMFRISTFQAVGGYRIALAGGEEPDLCDRLRGTGGRILRIDAPMGEHDSGVDTFGDWWSRSARVGRASAALLDDRTSQHDGRAVRAVRGALVWGALVPTSIVAGAVVAAVEPRFAAAALTISAVLGALYPVQFVRIRRGARERGLTGRDASLYAASCIMSKFAGVDGWLRHRLKASPR